MRRPPSLSESYLSDYKFIADRFDPLVIRETDLTINREPIDKESVIAVTDEFNYGEYYTEYVLRFLLHITMISFFETLFFFQFVSKDEDNGIIGFSNYYINKVISYCQLINKSDIVYVNDLLNLFFNSTSVIESGTASSVERSYNNGLLVTRSWVYFGGLSGLLGLSVLFAMVKRYKIKWGILLFENLIFVTMLGLYEFMFFETIIKKYIAISPQEISKQFVIGLQTQCGIL